MFNNRELSIRVNKADKNEKDREVRNERAIFEDRVALTHTAIEDTVKTIFAGIFTYVVLDTFRQVMIARSTSKY